MLYEKRHGISKGNKMRLLLTIGPSRVRKENENVWKRARLDVCT
jgi:hypothetical protein